MSQTGLSFTADNSSDYGCHEQLLAQSSVQSQLPGPLHTTNEISCIFEGISDHQEQSNHSVKMAPNIRCTGEAAPRGEDGGSSSFMGNAGLSKFDLFPECDIPIYENKDTTPFQYSDTMPDDAAYCSSFANLTGMDQWIDPSCITEHPIALYRWHNNCDVSGPKSYAESSSFVATSMNTEAERDWSSAINEYVSEPFSTKFQIRPSNTDSHPLSPALTPKMESCYTGLFSPMSGLPTAGQPDRCLFTSDDWDSLRCLRETSPCVRTATAVQEFGDKTMKQHGTYQAAPCEGSPDHSTPFYPPLPLLAEYDSLESDIEPWHTAPDEDLGWNITPSDDPYMSAAFTYSNDNGLNTPVSMRGGYRSADSSGMRAESTLPDNTACAGRGSLRDKAMDQFIVKHRAAGMPYSKIKALGGFKEAESTLRGRYRTLTKPREARVRKPEWTENDITILKQTVEQYISAVTGHSVMHSDHLRRHNPNAQQHVLNRVPWKQVADCMANLGCYRFGNATVKKKYMEVMDL